MQIYSAVLFWSKGSLAGFSFILGCLDFLDVCLGHMRSDLLAKHVKSSSSFNAPSAATAPDDHVDVVASRPLAVSRFKPTWRNTATYNCNA